MAEGFANRYGSDVMQAFSAGLAPALIVQLLTRKVMEDKNINIDHHEPKEVSRFNLSAFDLIINMSGRPLPNRTGNVREWNIEDPIGKDEAAYVAVRDLIEMKVMQLILELRREVNPRETPKHSKRARVLERAPEDRS